MAGIADAPAPLPRRGARFWALYAAAWLPFILAYTVLISLEGTDPASALIGGTLTTVPLVLLGVIVLRGAERLADARSRRVAAAVHVAFALVYAAAWCASVVVALRLGAPPGALDRFLQEALGWQFLSGLMLYGVLAGVGTMLRHARRLREQEAAAARSEALRVRAELQALRAQLDPHFLFNTLHTLLGLVRRDQRAAEAALERFGDLLRYVLDANRDLHDEVSLGDELAFVRHYLALEALRLGDRLRVVEQVDPDSLDVAIPTFTLQPLVENAVRHGIAPRAEGGTLTIISSLGDDTVRLEVRDDGVGATAQQVASADGVGLRVVRHRLAVLHGARARMETSATAGEGFAVLIELPASTAPLHGAFAGTGETAVRS